MINRLYQFTALFFLLFTGFSASARGGLYHTNKKEDKKTSVRAANPNHQPSNYEYSINSIPLQVINVQQHRGAHSLHGFYHAPGLFSVGFKYLNFICGSGTSELSRFRKLILFPFHAFW
ncbi:hypothetical protein [Mucilaginibacter sp. SP1R1]|uniref:hypothetical protein n=1 Tax=Mucilaginibacter sp. SP1R1 TaxID=2723091 RepID=UPI0016125DE9|nr:hypothetical protein [Mucilaginibacter sp. SP1R1]MBB6148088.1 hypothetical protein [Mucilaginibacter sp. SP1R1]